MIIRSCLQQIDVLVLKSYSRQQVFRKCYFSSSASANTSSLFPQTLKNRLKQLRFSCNTHHLCHHHEVRIFCARQFSGSRLSITGNFTKQNANNRLPPYVWMTLGGTIVVACAGYFAFLESVPFTGRKRWIASSPEYEQRLGDAEYENLLRSFSRDDILPPFHPASKTVHRVGARIAEASQAFMQQYSNNNTTNAAYAAALTSSTGNKNKDYTYTVVRSNEANAFVLPGNHVFVLTGLFKYVKNEDELAVILGHEMAHNVARHHGEKLSSSFVLSVVALLSLLFDPTGNLISILLPTASILRELPHSRVQETEADHIGIQLAAMACYDPRSAPRVFARMNDHNKDSLSSLATPPEFLSTHPSHDSRIRAMDAILPNAVQVYHGIDGSGERCRAIRAQMKHARAFAALSNP